MSIRRIGILLSKEFIQGPKNFMFIWVIVIPIVISLAVTLIFGSLFSGKPRLGIVDEGKSSLIEIALEQPSIIVTEYESLVDMETAVESGGVDMGLLLPTEFDRTVDRGEKITVEALIWGESLAQNRAILRANIITIFRELTGSQSPVEVETILIGEEKPLSWQERLLPFIVLMTVFIGGLFLPATSLINEREKRTLLAVVLTPATTGDVFLAKGIQAMLLSMVMGILILIINQAFGSHAGLLILVLTFGALMAVTIGTLSGALLKDVTTFFALWKSLGIILFGPAIVYMFPQIPQWIGKIFPTYYVIQPITEITQRGAGWSDISLNFFILLAIDAAFIILVTAVLRRMRTRRVVFG